ncbi:MAG: hypothetical protein ACPGQD_00445 [Planctomycetota bacterium]
MSRIAPLLAVLGLALGTPSCASPAPDSAPTLGQSLASDWDSAMDDARALVMPSRVTSGHHQDQGWLGNTMALFASSPGYRFGEDTDRDYRWQDRQGSRRSATYGMKKWALNYDPLDPSR